MPSSPLPYNKILDLSKPKASADNKFYVAQFVKVVLERTKITIGKGENVGYLEFLIYLTLFSKSFFMRVNKIRGCVVKGRGI